MTSIIYTVSSINNSTMKNGWLHTIGFYAFHCVLCRLDLPAILGLSTGVLVFAFGGIASLALAIKCYLAKKSSKFILKLYINGE